jgi:carbonic anhydrase/acetyltransferase-like protein (isoleucine patch superfamily)
MTERSTGAAGRSARYQFDRGKGAIEMLIQHRGNRPTVDPTAFVAPTAVLVGNVTLGSRSRVMYGAILDSEGSRVEVGDCVVVCENAVLRATAEGDAEYPVMLGDHVFVSPHATLLGCTVERCSYVATGATILQGANVRSGAAVAVGALVHAGTVVPAEAFVPPNSVAIGDPMKLYSASDVESVADAIRAVGFARRAFGAPADWSDKLARYEQATEVRSGEFAEHVHDTTPGRRLPPHLL